MNLCMYVHLVFFLRSIVLTFVSVLGGYAQLMVWESCLGIPLNLWWECATLLSKSYPFSNLTTFISSCGSLHIKTIVNPLLTTSLLGNHFPEVITLITTVSQTVFLCLEFSFQIPTPLSNHFFLHQRWLLKKELTVYPVSD